MECEHCHKRETDEEQFPLYTYPVEVDGKILTTFLCDNCAAEEGFCPCCGYFVLGSSDDYTLSGHGLCAECLEELRIELGEYDEQDDYYGD